MRASGGFAYIPMLGLRVKAGCHPAELDRTAAAVGGLLRDTLTTPVLHLAGRHHNGWRSLTPPPATQSANQDNYNGRHGRGGADGLPQGQVGRDEGNLFQHVGPSARATMAGARSVQRGVRIAATMRLDPL
jgi:hypothetical protein